MSAPQHTDGSDRSRRMPSRASPTRWTSIAVVGLAVGLSAVLLAIGAMTLMLVQLLRWAPAPHSAPRAWSAAGTKPEPLPGRKPPDAPAILARNVFDSSPKPPPEAAPAPVVPQSDPSAVCDLPLRLTAVMFDPEQPARSLAVLRGADPNSSRLSAIGTRFGDHRLTEVSPRSARFERAHDSCWLHMFGAFAHDKIEVERANARARSQPAKSKKRRRRAAAAIQSYPPPRALSPAELARGIRRDRADSYVLDRQLMEKALERWDRVAATTRLAVYKHRGHRGLRIRSLRDAGLLASLGLRRGDVLRTINGRKISRKRDLRLTVAELGGGEPVSLGIERDKRALRFDYVAR